jgi:hypothetical protein
VTFLLSLFKLFTAGGSIFTTIENLYKARLNAANDQERMAIDAQIATLQAQADIQKGDAWSDLQRAFLSAPFEVYLWKVLVWDFVLGWGTTPALDAHLWYVFMVIVGFFFVNPTTISTTIGRWIAK